MKRFISRLVPQKIKNIYHLVQAMIACFIFGFPSRKLKVIGVTGTNGKTTTTQFIARILERAGYQVAVASTINFQIGKQKWVNASKFTTLSSWQLQKFLREAVKKGCDYAVIETSSHALHQNRVWGIHYAIAVITNVTREHLDYHKTIAEYRRAKLKLFRKAKKVIVNLDMENFQDFLKFDNEKKYLYTCHPERSAAESKDLIQLDSSAMLGMTLVRAEDIEKEINYSQFKIQNYQFKIYLPGMFNVENALAAVCVGLAENISLEICAKALQKIQGVSGRMERVPNELGLNIIIDYAVTPDAFEKLYAAVLPLKSSGTKIIHVFGACGERDRGKRPIMGAIASRYADIIILTNEDPYYEDPERIIDEIEKGITKKKEDYFRISNRREAIRQAISLAKSSDTILITGKGAEVIMAIGDKRLPWNEREVIEEELAA